MNTAKILSALSALAVGACAHAPTPREVETVTLTFTTPTLYVDGTPIPQSKVLHFNVWQGQRTQNKTHIGVIEANGATVQIPGPFGPGEVCWQLTTQEVGGGLSDVSLETETEGACKTFASEPPDPEDPPRIAEQWTATITAGSAGART